MFRLCTALVAVCIALSCTAFALAATTGLVRGTITLDGKPIPAAHVVLEGEGSLFQATADAHGNYVFSQVPFGSYRLVASAKGGHETAVLVNVASGQVITVNVALTIHLKEIAQTTVTAHAGLEANPPSVNQLNRATIQSSPVNNSLDRLIETLPGVVQFSYNEPVINGFHGVSYNIDGAPLPLATTSNFAEIMDPKLINSIEVLTGAIPAEYGGERMGGVVNIISNRPTDLPEGTYGTITGGFGNQGQGVGSLDVESRSGSSEFFLSGNVQTTDRGLDAPTYTPINDDSSSSDQFFRSITQLAPRDTLAFDYSNQFSQFQIPINTDPNNPLDPVVSVPGTLDTQLEYDRFSNLNWTQTSKDGNGVLQVIPWWRSTQIDYLGDLPLDVLAVEPNFSDCPPSCAKTVNLIGLNQGSFASYVGVRASDFRATQNHAWKIGVDVDRESATAWQEFACYYVDCAASGKVATPYYAAFTTPQGQAGSNIGIYGEDRWQMGPNVLWSYGMRYDHSTGYVGGWQLSPRIGVNISDGGRNVAHVYYGKFYAAPLLEDVRQACVLLSAQQACSTTNPVYDLKPESDSYYEMGVVHTFNSHFTGSLNVFEKSVVNVLDTTQLFNTPIFAVYNNAIGIDHGAEIRLQDQLLGGDQWFLSGTVSGSYAACISGSEFLFPPNSNEPGVSCAAQLSLEDHSQTVDATAGYTHRFGAHALWYSTLQANYGSGFPVQFEDANVNLSGTLPAHTTFDFSLGRELTPGRAGEDRGLGLSLQVLNVLNHQYPIKVANGFNTTQIANGRSFLLRLSAPF
ncbi:MAG TPA: TonB-dependent receptor [Candidatus Cybelea sp.]|jgi:outer membrane receptor protein involved in Fe transport|nr:TonB-dependent receptor [Candidatus Cybelea sp.]